MLFSSYSFLSLSTSITDHEYIFIFCHTVVNTFRNVNTYARVNYAGGTHAENGTSERIHGDVGVNIGVQNLIETL